MTGRIQDWSLDLIIFQIDERNSSIKIFRLENLTLIEEFRTDKEKMCCFYLSDMTCKLGFLTNLFFDVFIYPGWIPIITRNCFIWNIVQYYIFDSFVKQIHFLVNINICKTHCPWKLIYHFSDIFYVCFSIVSDFFYSYINLFTIEILMK